MMWAREYAHVELERVHGFSYTGEYYNFPFVQVNLMDSTDQVVGYKIFYPNLEGINTGYWYNQYIVSNRHCMVSYHLTRVLYDGL